VFLFFRRIVRVMWSLLSATLQPPQIDYVFVYYSQRDSSVGLKGPIGGRPPPRECPICGDSSFWSAGERRYASVYAYNDHLRDKHQEYRTWKRRLSALYAVPIALLLASVPASVIRASATSGVDLLVFLMFWVLALLAGLLIVRVRGRGTKRFRNSWLQEHGQPTLS
jgi:hypothetical protein